ncbi:MAG: hypothetical protein P0S94_00115 [Simkaniaceae bacterium]|nr:hypothetical protein [Simkaniaceae bacterium]
MRGIKIAFITLFSIVALCFILWMLVPTIVSSKLSSLMGVDVSVGHIGFGSKSTSVKDLIISNPKGVKLPTALKINTIDADVPVSMFLKDDIVINNLNLNDIYISLVFEKKGSSNGNWTIISSNMSKNVDTSAKSQPNTHVLIKSLLCTNITIDLLYQNEGKVERLRPIDKIELRNISSSGGIPTNQIINLIIDQMLREIFSVRGITNMLKGVLESGGSGFFQTFEGFFSLDEQAQ